MFGYIQVIYKSYCIGRFTETKRLQKWSQKYQPCQYIMALSENIPKELIGSPTDRNNNILVIKKRL